jgi:hypothetical protein
MTYGAIRICAKERVLERGVWGKVRRRGPRVASRNKRNLSVRGLVSYQNRSSCPKGGTHTALPGFSAPSPATLPMTKMCCRGKRQSAIKDQTKPPGEEAYLSERGRHVEVEQHRHQVRHRRLARAFAQRAYMQRDRLARANGEGEAAISGNGITAARLNVGDRSSRNETYAVPVHVPF